ncbi:MAG: carboxypeptidase regulatory-like domain-containing protein [Cytophagaceae bacterium]|nr:carboxypeptidase regulatory-like domain-containing protein [Cytophagaceae bacterium]
MLDGAGQPAKDADGNVVASTTTDATGKYQFSNLKPGVQYVVEFTKPSGYEPTAQDKGGDDTKDSDANTTTGKSQTVVLESGENNPTIDAGYFKPATIGDFVFEDKNGNGIQDPTEPGIPGVTVKLNGSDGQGNPVTLTTTTDGTGKYEFTNVKPGTYTVTFTKPADYTTTDPNQGTDDTKDSDADKTTGTTQSVTVVSGEENKTLDAGYFKPAKLGDYVWEDTNKNGVQDSGEPGISGATVKLTGTTSTGAPVSLTTTTDANGKYEFTNLAPGTYTVEFVTPGSAGDYTNSPENSGSDDTKDSDANVVTGKTSSITIQSGDDNKTVDAGFYKCIKSAEFNYPNTPICYNQPITLSPIFGAGSQAGVFSSSPVLGSALNTSTGVINVAVAASGSYTITNTILADGKCPVVVSTSTVRIPEKLDISGPITKTDVKCFGDNTGSATIIVKGGTQPYTYNWSNGGTTSIIDNLVAGTYSVTITDANSCTLTAQVTINQSTQLVANAATVNVTCKDGNDGSISVNVTGGLAPYTYVWSNGAPSSATITGLTAGTYSVVVKDANNCSKEITDIIITEPAKLIATAGSNTPVCAGTSILLTSTGGTSYSWTGPNGFTSLLQNPEIANAQLINGGTYNVTAKDAKGCSATASVVVEVRKLNELIGSTSEVCEGEDLTITLPDYGTSATYSWTGPNGYTASGRIITLNNVTNTNEGTYNITVSVNGCSVTSTAKVIVKDKPNPPVVSIVGPTTLCENGSVKLQITNCNGIVKWSTGETGTSINVSIEGTYTANCEVNGCLSGVSNSVVVTKGTTPGAPVISAVKTLLCDGESTTLSATGCNGTLLWSTGATASTITVSVAGNYTANCSNACGASNASNTVVIETGVKPTAPVVTTDKTVCCDGEKATLRATGCNGTVTWSTGATGTSIQVGESGNYTATCTTTCGTSSSSIPVTIQKLSKPTAPVITGSTGPVCANEKVTLSASACTTGTLKWSTGETTSTISVGAGTYTAVCENICGSSPASNTIIVVPGTVPTAPTISGSTGPVCGTEKVTLSASACTSGTLKWSTGETTSTIIVGAGTYSAVCINSCGSSPSSNTITVTQGATPTPPTLTSDKSKVCGTEKATLTATGCNGTVTWSVGGTGTTKEVSAGSYTATCTNACGTSAASLPIVIGSEPLPSAPVVTTDKTVCCDGEKATLRATGCNGTVTWSTGATGTSIQVGESGNYTATCTTTCGTSSSSTPVTIQKLSKPTAPTITGSTGPVCANEKVILSASACTTGTLKWSTGETTSTISVGAGTYSAVCENICGSSPASNTIIVLPGTVPTAPTISGSTGPVCGTEKVTLSASACTSGTLKWSTGETTSTIIVGAGTYSAVCINSCGSSPSSNTITVTQGATPTPPTLTSDKSKVCGTEKATLTATGCNGTVTWSVGGTGTTKEVSAGSYTATCTNACGTSAASLPIVIGSEPLPSAPVVTTDKTVCCDGEKATLRATGCNGTVTWSTGATGTSIQVGESGNYTATCTTTCGTSSSSTPVTIQKLSKPTAPTITGSTGPVCANEKVILSASACTTGTLKWSTGETTSTISVGAGTYSAVCENICGSSPASNTIIVLPGTVPTAPTISGSTGPVCGTEKVTLSASACTSGTLKWSTGETTSTIIVGAGTYSAVCINSCGSSPSSNTITVTQGATPTPPTLTSDKSKVCGTEKATLTATGCNGTVTWSVGGTGTTKEVSAGSYTATCTNACGTSAASLPIVIGSEPLPSAPVVTTDKTVCCDGEKATLRATGCNGTVTWSTGATGTSIQVGESGNYTATCTTTCGTSSSSTPVTIQKLSKPTAPTITGSTGPVCANEKVILSASACTTGTLKWSTGETTSTISVGAGTYSAVCENICGSSPASNTIIVVPGTVPTAPTISGSTGPVCGTEKVTLSASACTSGTLKWSTGETTSTIIVGAGTYSAVCINSCGSSPSSNTITVTQGATPTPPTLTSDKSKVCGTEKATLTATGCNGTVTWSVGGTGTTKEVSAGSYTATCTNACGTSVASLPIVIGSEPLPTAPVVTTDKTVCCDGEKATLRATGCNGTVTWSTGATGTSIQVGESGNYTATCTTTCGTSSSSTPVTIQKLSKPTAPTITGSTGPVCANEKVALSASACTTGTLKWSTGETTSTISVGAGTYTAVCENICGSSPASNTIIVLPGTVPTAPTISGSTGPVCGTEKVTLSASACTSGTLKWSTGETTSTIIVGAGTYSAVCINSCGSSPSSNTITVTQGATPTPPTLTSDKSKVCGTEKATLTATGCNGTVTWSVGGTGTTKEVSAGSYTATCTNACGTSAASLPIVIGSEPLPSAPVVTTDKTVCCDGEKATLRATGCNGTVTWSTGATGTSIQVGESGNYTATCTTTCGTSSSSTPVTIQKLSKPTAPTITGSTGPVCANEKVILSASACTTGTLKWSTGETTSTISVGAGTYSAVCENICGSSPASNTIIVVPGTVPTAPTISGSTGPVCGTEKVTLSASACTSGTLKWSTGETTSTIIVGAGTYSAVCINSCGSSPSSNTITVTQGATPTPPTLTSNKSTVCGTEKATLTATGCNGTVTWSVGGTGTTKEVSAGSYTATCTNACGTSVASAAITIGTGVTPSAPTITGSTGPVCGTEKVTLTASSCSSGTIRWSTSETTSTISVGAGTYTATCVNDCGSSPASNAITVTQGATPTAPTLTSNKSTVCGTEKATLTATGCNGTVTWSVGGTGTTKEVSAGTYTATCTNACGTSVASAAITIGTGVTPTAPTITGSTGPVCGTEKVTLSASACTSGTIRWSTSETTSTISVGAGTYTATCVNDCGSSPASNTITVTQGATPTAPTLTSNKSTVCGTEKATLTATGCNGTVTWSVGGTGTTKEVSAGTYTATCTNACGTSVASAAITIGTGVTPTAPTITGSTGPVCGTEKVTLTASSCSSGTIRWSTSETTSTISVGAGTYTATCVNDCGSSPASNAITVTQGATPTAPTLTSNKSTVCGTEKATLTATGCNGTVTWSVGGTGTTKEVSAGTYTVTCTNACGTSVASAAITIGTGVTPTAPTITGSTGPVCGTEKVTLSASACTSGTIRWSTSETTSTISVGAGTYTATCVNDCGSSPASNTITVTQGATPTAPTLTSNKSTVCGTEKATLTATGCNGTVTWSVGGTGTTKEVSAGTYTATCTNACGTSVASAAITIGTGVTPTAPTITGSTGPVCGTEKVTLTASACTSGTIRWSTSETTSTISVGAGTYTATCVNDCGSSPSSNAITVTQGITPSAPVIAASKNEICGTESITLTATNCTGQIKWSNNATGTSTTISNPGDYAAVCITACGESPNSNIVTIVRGAIPNPPLVTTDKVSVCGTEKARLVAIGCSSTVIWNTGEQGESILVGTGTYTAVCSNSCGSSVASNVVKIDVNGRPSAPSITADRTSICGSDSAKLTSEGCSGTVTWSNGKIGNSIFVKQIGTYTAKCTNDCGTSIDSDPITITSGGSAPVAPVIAANKTSICVGDSAILTVTGCSGTVTWNTSGVGNRIVVYSPGTYSAVCSNGCGTSPNSNAIVIERKTTGCSGTGCNITAPVISASKLTICEPEDITLTAAGCATGTVIWSNGKTGASIVVKPVANTTYNAVCKLDTCISAVSQSLTIKVNKTTKPIIACATDLVCPGETTTLTAYECEGEVKWSNGMIGHQIEVAPTTLSKYTAVCVVGTCTSEASDTVCVNVGVPAKPFIACKSNTICFGESAIITATGCNGVVVWSTGQSGSVLTVTPTTSGVFHYTAKCRAKSGECQSDDSNIISISVGGVVAAPKALSEVKNVCPFETVDLNSAILGDPSTSGGSYEFHISNSPNSTLITTTGSVQAGNYYLFERSKFGCFSTPTMITVKIDNCGPGGNQA